MIRVLIADDHAIVRQGLAQLLETEDDIEVVGQASDGAEAITMAGDLLPDVILMDLSMPGVDGIEATRQITGSTDSEAADNIVVLTSFADQAHISAALEAGASGYILKDAPPDDVISAVRAAARGGAPLDPRAARVLLDQQRQPRPGRGLSARETEVLELLAEGLPNKQIARRLGIADRTVKAHLTNVFQQLGVTDRTQAALWARENLPRPNEATASAGSEDSEDSEG